MLMLVLISKNSFEVSYNVLEIYFNNNSIFDQFFCSLRDLLIIQKNLGFKASGKSVVYLFNG